MLTRELLVAALKYYRKSSYYIQNELYDYLVASVDEIIKTANSDTSIYLGSCGIWCRSFYVEICYDTLEECEDKCKYIAKAIRNGYEIINDCDIDKLQDYINADGNLICNELQVTTRTFNIDLLQLDKLVIDSRAIIGTFHGTRLKLYENSKIPDADKLIKLSAELPSKHIVDYVAANNIKMLSLDSIGDTSCIPDCVEFIKTSESCRAKYIKERYSLYNYKGNKVLISTKYSTDTILRYELFNHKNFYRYITRYIGPKSARN